MPRHLESLELSIKELQAELHEAKTRNLYLSNLVEEQKTYYSWTTVESIFFSRLNQMLFHFRKILEHERLQDQSGGSRPSTQSSSVSTLVNAPFEDKDPGARQQEEENSTQEYLERLQEAEQMIAHLKQENEKQKEEVKLLAVWWGLVIKPVKLVMFFCTYCFACIGAKRIFC